MQGGLGTAVGEVQGHSARCILDLAQRPAFPTSRLTSGESRHTYQLVVGCDREVWGCGLRELRARPEGMAAGAVGRLGRAGGRAPEGEHPAEAASRETKPCACQVDWCWLCPWRAELGLWEPFSGRPHPPGWGPSLHPSPTSGKQYSWVGPEPRWCWVGRGRGGPRPGPSSAAWNEEGARAPGRQLGFRVALCLFKAVGP